MNLKMSYTNDNQVVPASMFNTHGFRGRDKMVAFFQDDSLKLIFSYEFFFFKFDYDVFLNFQIQI